MPTTVKSLILVLFIIAGTTNSQSQNAQIPEISVKKLWATDKILETPESVIYDDVHNTIYVSNISGSPLEKDGNGFISKLSCNGEIEKLKWIEGLNAPKGMGIFEDKLYVTDIDRVVEISISEGRVLKKYKSRQAQFLNDISIDPSGVVYISDNRVNTIFRLWNKKIDPWLNSPDFAFPNGLCAENDRLLIGNEGFILSVDYQTKKITRFIEDTDFIDGLEAYEDGQYLVSDFLGSVHLVSRGNEKAKLLDTSTEEIMAADIDFIGEKKILLVPTFYDNRIFAYQIKHGE